MNNLGFEFRKLTGNDLEIKPLCFANDIDKNGEMMMFWLWAIIQPEGSDTPHFYYRSMMMDGFRKNAGINKLGNGPFEPQTGVHHYDIANENTRIIPYRKTSENPLRFEVGAEDPYFHVTYEETGLTIKEADVLDVKVDFWPYCFITHANGPTRGMYLNQFGTMTGTYEGKPIKAICACDRGFASQEAFKPSTKDEVFSSDMTYMLSYHAGIRDDGRRECFYAKLNARDKNGCGEGVYWLEGEPPIITSNTSMQAEWYHLPYLPKGDKTVHYNGADWNLDNKISIHCDSSYGSKGFSGEIRQIEGIAQTYGDFYVGTVPYKHPVWIGLQECIAHDDTMKNWGFVVHD